MRQYLSPLFERRCRRRREAAVVGCDVVDGVGRSGASVDDDVTDELSVEERHRRALRCS